MCEGQLDLYDAGREQQLQRLIDQVGRRTRRLGAYRRVYRCVATTCVAVTFGLALFVAWHNRFRHAHDKGESFLYAFCVTMGIVAVDAVVKPFRRGRLVRDIAACSDTRSIPFLLMVAERGSDVQFSRVDRQLATNALLTLIPRAANTMRAPLNCGFVASVSRLLESVGSSVGDPPDKDLVAACIQFAEASGDDRLEASAKKVKTKIERATS